MIDIALVQDDKHCDYKKISYQYLGAGAGEPGAKLFVGAGAEAIKSQSLYTFLEGARTGKSP